MKDRILEYTGVFCDDVALLGLLTIEAEVMKHPLKQLAEVLDRLEVTVYEVDALTSLIASEDTHLPLEPLWVRKQQQKSFKRGKK